MLIKRGADVSARDGAGNKPFDLAVARGKVGGWVGADCAIEGVRARAYL